MKSFMRGVQVCSFYFNFPITTSLNGNKNWQLLVKTRSLGTVGTVVMGKQKHTAAFQENTILQTNLGLDQSNIKPQTFLL
jgi:hypothetical protein